MFSRIYLPINKKKMTSLKHTIGYLQEKEQLLTSLYDGSTFCISSELEIKIVDAVEAGNDVVIFSIPKNYSKEIIELVERQIDFCIKCDNQIKL